MVKQQVHLHSGTDKASTVWDGQAASTSPLRHWQSKYSVGWSSSKYSSTPALTKQVQCGMVKQQVQLHSGTDKVLGRAACLTVLNWHCLVLQTCNVSWNGRPSNPDASSHDSHVCTRHPPDKQTGVYKTSTRQADGCVQDIHPTSRRVCTRHPPDKQTGVYKTSTRQADGCVQDIYPTSRRVCTRHPPDKQTDVYKTSTGQADRCVQGRLWLYFFADGLTEEGRSSDSENQQSSFFITVWAFYLQMINRDNSDSENQLQTIQLYSFNRGHKLPSV